MTKKKKNNVTKICIIKRTIKRVPLYNYTLYKFYFRVTYFQLRKNNNKKKTKHDLTLLIFFMIFIILIKQNKIKLILSKLIIISKPNLITIKKCQSCNNLKMKINDIFKEVQKKVKKPHFGSYWWGIVFEIYF